MRTFPGDIITSLLREAAEIVAEKIPEISDHRLCWSRAAYQQAMDTWGVEIECEDCQNRRRVYFSAGWVALTMSKPIRAWDDSEAVAVEFWVRQLIPAAAPLAEAPCWNPKGLAATAEWLTDAVARGGAQGRDLKALIQWARSEAGVPAERVLWLLERMGFTPKSAMVPRRIRLPVGHPARTWEEDLPHPGDGTLDESVLLALDWPV